MKTKTIKVRDLQIGDIIRMYGEDQTVESIHPYGTSYHSLIIVTDKTSKTDPLTLDTLTEVELVGFMSPHFTIPVESVDLGDAWNNVFHTTKPKVKRKSKIVQRIEDAGYHIEKTGREWHVWHKDDHSVTAIYDRLRDIPSFPPYV